MAIRVLRGTLACVTSCTVTTQRMRKMIRVGVQGGMQNCGFVI